MKIKFVLPLVLVGLLGFVLIDIFSAGNRHVEVVDENVALVSENQNLRTENNKLHSLNDQLLAENKQLNQELTNTTLAIKKEKESVLPKAIVKIEEEIELELGWSTPDIAYSLLEDKLKRKPTVEEYKKTLEDLLNKNLLFYPGNPDPYVKGKKISSSDLTKIINQK